LVRTEPAVSGLSDVEACEREEEEDGGSRKCRMKLIMIDEMKCVVQELRSKKMRMRMMSR
jgi:hypothetical protein